MVGRGLDMGTVVIALAVVVEGDIASVLEHVAVAGIARYGVVVIRDREGSVRSM
jgi:hypothetical protein